MIASLEIAIVLCSLFLVAMPAIAAQEQNQEMQKVSASEVTTASEDDYVLGVYGNANEDDTIDMRDLTYVKLIFFGKKPETELSDAKYDGKINPLDFIQIKLIIVGKEKELTIVDATERTVTVPIPLERVVIFSSYSAEAMRAIGVDLSEKIVGAYDFMIRRRPEYFSEIADKPNVGSGKEPDYEKIAELQPEVVVFYPYYKPNVKEEVIEKMGAVVLYESLYEPDAISQELKKLGMIYQKEEQAEELIKWYQSYEELIVSRTSKLSPDEIPKVFLYSFPYYYKEKGIYATNNREGLFHHSAVKAGLVNIAADLPVKNPRVSLEWILVQDPNVIIGQLGDIASYAAEESVIDELKELREQIRNTPGIRETKAARENKIFFVGRDILNGVDYVVAIAYIAKYVHPELFEDLDPIKIHEEYLQFQGMEYRGVWAYPPMS